MQRLLLIIAACSVLLLVAGCGSDSSTSATSDTETTSEGTSSDEGSTAAEEEAPDLPKVNVPKGPPPKKLVIDELKKGTGATAKAGDMVSVDYVGVVYATKELFDANWEGEKPFTFKLGAQEVIKGWDQGIQGMKVGGERKLIIPPGLAYGEEAIFPSIPANSTLIFLTKLISVK